MQANFDLRRENEIDAGPRSDMNVFASRTNIDIGCGPGIGCGHELWVLIAKVFPP